MSDQGADTPSAGVFRVVSYNLHKVGDDRRSLVRVLTALKPDILIAQEAPRGFRWRPRCAELLREAGLFYAVGGGGAAAGNLIGTSMRTEVVATIEEGLPTPTFVQSRGLAAAIVELGDFRVAAAGTHLDLDVERRAGHLDRLTTRAHAFAAEYDAPLVLGADLNETPEQRSWASLAAAGLADHGAHTGLTIPSVGPDRRIDAVLTAEGLEVLDYRVGLEALAGQPADDEPITHDTLRAASDHLPVMALISRR